MNHVTSIYLERIDPARNLARFYLVEIQHDLFGNVVTVRRWGRIGTRGRQLLTFAISVAHAMSELEHWKDVKCRRGYRQC